MHDINTEFIKYTEFIFLLSNYLILCYSIKVFYSWVQTIFLFVTNTVANVTKTFSLVPNTLGLVANLATVFV